LISSQKFSEAFLIFRRIRRDITINAQTAYCKVTLFLIGSLKTLIFLAVIHLSIRFFLTAFVLFRKPNAILLCFYIDLDLNFLFVMAACTPFIHVFPGPPLFLLSRAIQSIIGFGIFSFGRQLFIKWEKILISNFVKIHPMAANKHFVSSNAANPPLNQHSIQISPETKSLSYAHNSVTAHIMRQMNPRYILLHIYFGSNPIFFYSQITSYDADPPRVSGQNF